MTTRRDFIKLTAAGAGALMLGIVPRGEAADAFTPNVWLRIDADGKITITAGKSEMGQGVRTSLPMIVAEELDADWSRVEIIQASPSATFKGLGTGGSWSTRGSWERLRAAGASAREMLATAAANRWNVDRASVRSENGFVLHDDKRLGYGELVADAAKLPVPQTPPLKTKFKLLGTRIPRVDGPRIVNGSAIFGLDVRVPGMLYATLARPPRFGATLVSFDATKAKAIVGVRNVIKTSRGVAVVATNTFAAMQGRDALAIEWKDGPGSDFDSDAFAKVLESAGEGIVTRSEGTPPVDAKRLEATYRFPFQAHAPLEPMNCVAHVTSGKCTLWAPTQAPNNVQESVAKLLDITPENVTVNVTLMGGGFGRRLAWDYALEAAEISRAVDAPVQIVWTRGDDMKHGHYQAASLHAMSGAIDANGHAVAWSHRKVAPLHNARDRHASAEDLRDAQFLRDSSWGVYDIPYRIPSIETRYTVVDSPVLIGPWRSVFSPSSTFARECFLDELAHAAGRDPLDFRLELLAGDPQTFTTGELTIDRARLTRVLQLVKQKSGWGTPLPKGRGRGAACNVYDGEIHIAYVAEVEADEKRWRVTRVVAAVDCGLVINRSGLDAQIEGGILWGLSAMRGQITFRNGAVEQSSFADFPVVRIDESPAIEIHVTGTDATVPFGMGEPPVPPVIPAIGNALFAATGKRIRALPVP